MIAFGLVGTNKLEDATAFYDKVMATLGASRAMSIPGRMATWGTMWDGHFGVVTPWDKQDAAVGNGTMVALQAETRAQIDAAHAAALAAGGTDEGAPGVRGPNADGFYGAYFRDLDGNKVCVMRFGPDPA